MDTPWWNKQEIFHIDLLRSKFSLITKIITEINYIHVGIKWNLKFFPALKYKYIIEDIILLYTIFIYTIFINPPCILKGIYLIICQKYQQIIHLSIEINS